MVQPTNRRSFPISESTAHKSLSELQPPSLDALPEQPTAPVNKQQVSGAHKELQTRQPLPHNLSEIGNPEAAHLFKIQSPVATNAANNLIGQAINAAANRRR